MNAEKLLFNWQQGRDLVQKKAEERWGAGVVEQISLDLRREFPKENGFSTRNLWYMKQWYLFYTEGDSQFLHQLGAEIQRLENQHETKLHQVGAEILKQSVSVIEDKKLHQLGGEFPLSFALVPWRHHVEIITKSKSIEEALFYVGITIERRIKP